jgi:hypothetical protein
LRHGPLVIKTIIYKLKNSWKIRIKTAHHSDLGNEITVHVYFLCSFLSESSKVFTRNIKKKIFFGKSAKQKKEGGICTCLFIMSLSLFFLF